MKKILLLAVFAVISLAVNAQTNNESTYEFFIDVHLVWAGKNFVPHLYFDDKASEYIYDASGEKLKFKSRSSIINHFTKLGWSFVQNVKASNGDEWFLLKKQVKTVQEAKEGLIFENDLKK